LGKKCTNSGMSLKPLKTVLLSCTYGSRRARLPLLCHWVGSLGGNLRSFPKRVLDGPEDKIAIFGNPFPSRTLGALLLFSHPAVSDSLWPPWTVAHQAPLSLGFPRQEYHSRLPFPSPEDLPNLKIKPLSPALAGGFFITESPGKPLSWILTCWELLWNLSMNLIYDGLTFDTSSQFPGDGCARLNSICLQLYLGNAID